MGTSTVGVAGLSFGKRLALGWNLLVERLLVRKKLDELCLVLGGHIFFQTLASAARLGVFTLLDRKGALARPQICSELGLSDQPVRILLLGCVALGLLEKDGDRYRNTKAARLFLSADHPKNILSIIDWQHFINYRALYHFHDAILANANVGLAEFSGNESTLYGRLVHAPELEQIFQRAMQSISVQSNHLLAKYMDFSSVRHLVDVGGGNGSNILELARHNPQLRASVFDSPSVCELARRNIAEHGQSDRLGAVPGDCFKDPFPADVDCLMFCHFFTIWSPERNQQLLQKAFDALPTGGSAVVFNMMQDDDERGPLTAAMGSPYFLTLATGQGMLYTWGEYEAWMRKAGFRRVVRRTFIRNHGAIIGIK
jgi:SAM-dependent methyltransferase